MLSKLSNSFTELGAVIELAFDSSKGFTVFRLSVMTEVWLSKLYPVSQNVFSRP